MLPRSGQTVRELENIIQRMIALAESEHIDADVLPPR
jgi:DNA-binding NtrC family response regulator